MKKTVLIIILAVLVLFCLISIAVGGFFGWRFYQKHKLTEASVKSAIQQQMAQTSPSQEANAPEQEANAPEQETNAPGMEANTPAQSEPGAIQPQEEAQGETPSAGQTQPESGMTPQETPAAAPKTEPAPAPAPKPARRKSSRRSTPAPQPAPAATPEPQPSSAPEQTTSAAPAPAQESQPAPAEEAAPEKKTPRGTLGLIFETKVDQGEIIIHVDGKVVVAQGFTASGDKRYRLTKGLRLIPGPHRVKVKVLLPDGKKEIKEWTAMVVKGGDTVWKIEMKTFPRTLDIKPIQ